MGKECDTLGKISSYSENLKGRHFLEYLRIFHSFVWNMAQSWDLVNTVS